jgi:hypothetical protein
MYVLGLGNIVIFVPIDPLVVTSLSSNVSIDSLIN